MLMPLIFDVWFTYFLLVFISEIENLPFCPKSEEISFKIFSDSREMLKSIGVGQSSKTYLLSLPSLKFPQGESFSMIGSHRPMSMFQQLA
jgi:hypothetical protein